MKHITKWKLFESQDDEQDEDLIIKKGFKHSVADIEDNLLEITDIGFKIKDGIQQYYVNYDGGNWSLHNNKVYLSEANKSVIKFHLTKKIEDENKVYPIKSTWKDIDLFCTNDYKFNSQIQSGINSFCRHFGGNCYYSLNIDKDYYTIAFLIIDDIDKSLISEEKEKEKIQKAHNNISDSLRKFNRKVKGDVTKSFYEKAFKNLLGESMSWDFFGGAKSGFIIISFNLKDCTKSVLNTNIPKIKNRLDNINWDIPSDFVKSSEFRKLTIKDLQKLSKFYNKDLKYFTERYSDMDAIVIEFNYKKWFNKLLKNN